MGMRGVVAAVCAWAMAGGVALADDPPAKIALTGARIITVSGAEIARGTVVIEHGKITAVGVDVPIPYDAMEVDLSGKVVMPGFIDVHAQGPLDRANESLPVMPFLDVYDAIDPSRLFFEEALRNGITSVHVIQGNNAVIGGVSRVVMPIGLSVDEMTQRAEVALKLSTTPMGGFDRMRQMAAMREAFLELEDYLLKLAEEKYEKKLEAEGKKVDVGPAEARERGKALVRDADYDDQHRNLVRLKRGDLAAWVYAGAATDVRPAVETAREQGFLERTVLVLGPTSHKAAGELKRAGRPVVLHESLVYRERDAVTGELSETFVPRVIHDAGLTFALQASPGSSLAEQYLTYQAAACVREGIPRRVALRAITLTPAEMLGLGDRLGSIEVGKTANLVVLSGDPLEFTTWVERSYINGILAYDRERDARLKEVVDFERRLREKSAPAEGAAEGVPAEAPGADAPPAESPPVEEGARRGGGRRGGGEGGR